ncbi:MAG: hypothetical protein HRT71_10315 [Flavobacteriales bacterium]|nr:hypothetical protein [Flavobacteriales bacterium]
MKKVLWMIAMVLIANVSVGQDMDYAKRLFEEGRDKLAELGVTGSGHMQQFNKIKKAADMGYAEAIAYFGCELTKTGYTMIQRDVVKGVRYLDEALLLQSTQAMICMAYQHYDEGRIFECIELLDQAFMLGDYNAATDLGYLFKTGKLTNHPHAEPKYAKYGLNNDLASSLYYLQEASKNGASEAEILLSHWYFVGVPGHITRNTSKAKALMVRAMQEKDVIAHPWTTRQAEHIADDVYGVGWEEKLGM